MVDTADEFLAHFGIKGMRWGVSHPKSSSSAQPVRPRPTSSTPPVRPRPTRSTDSREDQLVTRAVNQGYYRVTAPAMNHFVSNIPKYSQSPDPRVNALLARSSSQAMNRIETQVGQSYMAGLPYNTVVTSG